MATTVKQQAKKTKKHRKHGRGLGYCKVYAASHRREHNKVRRLRKHLVRFPEDKVAAAAVERCKLAIRGS